MALSWTHSFKSVSFSEEPRPARSTTEVASPVVSRGEGDLMAALYLSNAARAAAGCLCHGGTLLLYVQLGVHQDSQSAICFTSCLPQLVLVEGVILLQWQDFAFPFVLSRHPLSHCADHLIIESCHANQALHFLLYKSMVTNANHLLNIFSDSFQHYLLHFLSRD